MKTAVRRLESVSDGTHTARYTDIATPLVSQIAFTQNGQPRITTTKESDGLNGLTTIAFGAPNSSSALRRGRMAAIISYRRERGGI